MRNKLDVKIMREFAALRLETYTYLTENNEENKKQKKQKNCIETTQFKNKINQREKTKFNVDSLTEKHKLSDRLLNFTFLRVFNSEFSYIKYCLLVIIQNR